MAKNILKTLASAFVVEAESQSQTTQNPQPTCITPNVSNKVPVQNQTVVNSCIQTSIVDASTQVPVVEQQPSLNEQLFERLCQRLEEENLPGPDYMELKRAVMDENMIRMMPDENNRITMAFISLKTGNVNFNKTHVLQSIDTYIGLLQQWKNDALTDIASSRGGVADKKNKISEMNNQVIELQKKIAEMQSEVEVIENKCAKNELDMTTAVDFLVQKLASDKEKINSIISE